MVHRQKQMDLSSRPPWSIYFQNSQSYIETPCLKKQINQKYSITSRFLKSDGDSNKSVESNKMKKDTKGWATEMAQCIQSLAAKPG